MILSERVVVVVLEVRWEKLIISIIITILTTTISSISKRWWRALRKEVAESNVVVEAEAVTIW